MKVSEDESITEPYNAQNTEFYSNYLEYLEEVILSRRNPISFRAIFIQYFQSIRLKC